MHVTSGCVQKTEAVQIAIKPHVTPRHLTTAELNKVKPNEVGRIPILMYHSIAESGKYDRRGLNISAATFRRQLEMMRNAGWYPVNMREVLTAHLNVPLGKTPVVLTFDDSRESQVRFLPNKKLSPICALGVMEAFHSKYPDWPLAGTFYVLPGSRWNPVPFGQKGKEQIKLARLLKEGFEIGNHTYTHRFMGKMNASDVQWEMTSSIRAIRAVCPQATMDTMALPYGEAPDNPTTRKFILDGEREGIKYSNRCILRAWGEPSYPFTDRRFNPQHVERVGAEPGYIEACIKELTMKKHYPRYISDGNPNTITIPVYYRSLIDKRRLEGSELIVY